MKLRNIKDFTKSVTKRFIYNVDFSNAQIGDECARTIDNALEVNYAIHEINLGNNQIGAEGVRVIVNALKANSSVHKINLFGNQIGAVVQLMMH